MQKHPTQFKEIFKAILIIVASALVVLLLNK